MTAVVLGGLGCSAGGSNASASRATPHTWRFHGTTVETSLPQGKLLVAVQPFAITLRPESSPSHELVAPGPAGCECADLGFMAATGLARVTSWAPTSRGSTLTGPAHLSDGTTATMRIDATRDRGVHIVLRPPAGSPRPSAWQLGIPHSRNEGIYGLTERIVDDYNDSELVPAEVGSLDRTDEIVKMYVTPTISGYAPFFQSSRGYGVLVDGTMPGTYDVAHTDPAITRVTFELPQRGPSAVEASIHLFLGDHLAILDQFTRLTGRPVRPPDAVFTHWHGRDEDPVGTPVQWHGIPINPTVAKDLAAYERARIPPGIFHFDRPWAVGTEGYGDLVWDPARFPNAQRMLAEMRRVGWKIEVWVSPWVLDAPNAYARAHGYLAPNSTRALDLTNPDAVAWEERRIVAFLRGPEGRYVDGFFLDRGDEADVSSQATDIYHDGRSGREIHNAYPVLYERMFHDALVKARGTTHGNANGWLLARPSYTGSQAYVVRWPGDTHSRTGVLIPEQPETSASTDKGLRSYLISMQRAAFMGTDFIGSDTGGYSQWNDKDLYARWIEVSALSPLMRFHGKGATPWDANADGTTDTTLLEIYRRYVRLHHALAPTLEHLAAGAHTNGAPIIRPLVFEWNTTTAREAWDEWLVGRDLLVAPVWRSGSRSRTVWIPPGKWTDVWHPHTTIVGPRKLTVDVPLDHIPLYTRAGSGLSTVFGTRRIQRSMRSGSRNG